MSAIKCNTAVSVFIAKIIITAIIIFMADRNVAARTWRSHSIT